MRFLRPAAAGMLSFVVVACTDGRDALGPTDPGLEPDPRSSEMAAPARQVETSGEFDALVDFSTLRLTPRGENCLLEVDGRLVFTGTIEGTSTGTTSALVFATCEEASTTPPGTHPDVFRSELDFVGTVDGQPVEADLLYMGSVQPGGRIEGRLIFSNGAAGRLETDGMVAVGGDYQGTIVVR